MYSPLVFGMLGSSYSTSHVMAARAPARVVGGVARSLAIAASSARRACLSSHAPFFSMTSPNLFHSRRQHATSASTGSSPSLAPRPSGTDGRRQDRGREKQ